MKTRAEFNKNYYLKNQEQEKKRSLNYYHQNKQKIDREAKKVYMAEYLKTYQRKKKTPEQKEERNQRRRMRYATDQVFREREISNAKNWSRKNPEKKTNQRLVEAFGITLMDFKEKLILQNYKCAICA